MAEIISEMLTFLKSQGSKLDKKFIELILKRLESFSYVVKESDAFMVGFSIVKVENKIKNACNTTLLPDGLKITAVDMICGEFLYSLKQTGKLNETFDFEMAVKQIQTGDTNVTFAVESSQTPEQKLNAFISYLITKGEGELVCYRKVKW